MFDIDGGHLRKSYIVSTGSNTDVGTTLIVICGNANVHGTNVDKRAITLEILKERTTATTIVDRVLYTIMLILKNSTTNAVAAITGEKIEKMRTRENAESLYNKDDREDTYATKLLSYTKKSTWNEELASNSVCIGMSGVLPFGGDIYNIQHVNRVHVEVYRRRGAIGRCPGRVRNDIQVRVRVPYTNELR